MAQKLILLTLALCFLSAFMLGAFCQHAYAQDAKAMDKGDLNEKRGIEGLFKGKGGADPRDPKLWQKVLGFGSFAVMIIVVKYL